MIDVAVLVPFIVASAVVILVPGADSFLLLRVSVSGGVRAGIRAMAGIELGNSIQAALMISGVGLFVSRMPHAITILKVFGSLYLLYLAAMSFVALSRHHRTRRLADAGAAGGPDAARPGKAETAPDDVGDVETAPVGADPSSAVEAASARTADTGRRGRAGLPPFWQGFLSNITNPKVLVFFVAFFPQFLGTATNASLQLLMLSVVFIVSAVLWALVIIFAAARLRRTMSSPGFARAMDLTCGVAFAALAIALWVV